MERFNETEMSILNGLKDALSFALALLAHVEPWFRVDSQFEDRCIRDECSEG